MMQHPADLLEASRLPDERDCVQIDINAGKHLVGCEEQRVAVVLTGLFAWPALPSFEPGPRELLIGNA